MQFRFAGECCLICPPPLVTIPSPNWCSRTAKGARSFTSFSNRSHIFTVHRVADPKNRLGSAVFQPEALRPPCRRRWLYKSYVVTRSNVDIVGDGTHIGQTIIIIIIKIGRHTVLFHKNQFFWHVVLLKIANTVEVEDKYLCNFFLLHLTKFHHIMFSERIFFENKK